MRKSNLVLLSWFFIEFIFYVHIKNWHIRQNETGNEYFVHATGLVDKITENDQVDFELTQGKKGLNAIDVKLVDWYTYTFFSINLACWRGFFVFLNNLKSKQYLFD